jgi:hypothetical protein
MYGILQYLIIHSTQSTKLSCTGYFYTKYRNLRLLLSTGSVNAVLHSISQVAATTTY